MTPVSYRKSVIVCWHVDSTATHSVSSHIRSVACFNEQSKQLPQQRRALIRALALIATASNKLAITCRCHHWKRDERRPNDVHNECARARRRGDPPEAKDKTLSNCLALFGSIFELRVSLFLLFDKIKSLGRRTQWRRDRLAVPSGFSLLTAFKSSKKCVQIVRPKVKLRKSRGESFHWW